jgi:hypothetical protein
MRRVQLRNPAQRPAVGFIAWLGLFGKELWRANIELKNLPLLAVFNESERHCRFSFFELRLRFVPTGNDFSGLRRHTNTGLSLHRLTFLKWSEGIGQNAKQLIKLLVRDGLLELGTDTIDELLLAPRVNYGRNRCISVGFAFFVQRIPADSNEPNADCAKHDDDEEDYSENCEELFHTRENGPNRLSRTGRGT